jgi:hypothetical protein
VAATSAPISAQTASREILDPPDLGIEPIYVGAEPCEAGVIDFERGHAPFEIAVLN